MRNEPQEETPSPAPKAKAPSSRVLRRLQTLIQTQLNQLKKRFGLGTSEAANKRRAWRLRGLKGTPGPGGVVSIGDRKYAVAKSGELRRLDLPWNPALSRQQRKEIARAIATV